MIKYLLDGNLGSFHFSINEKLLTNEKFVKAKNFNDVWMLNFLENTLLNLNLAYDYRLI